MKRDLNAELTDKIIQLLEKSDDMGKWISPWKKTTSSLPNNFKSGRQYGGANLFNLYISQIVKGYKSGKWGSFKQWNDKDVSVKKGEKSSIIRVPIPVKRIDEDGIDTSFIFFKGVHVFNADQVDGYDDKSFNDSPNENTIMDIAEVDKFIENTGAVIKIEGDQARYNYGEDIIFMPLKELFVKTETSSSTECWYSAILHEIAHWTGIEKRLNRNFSNDMDAYAFEELVAEISSVFLCKQLGVNNEFRIDHAQYIKHWIDILKKDNKLIYKAAGEANKVAQYLNGLQPKEVIEEDELPV